MRTLHVVKTVRSAAHHISWRLVYILDRKTTTSVRYTVHQIHHSRTQIWQNSTYMHGSGIQCFNIIYVTLCKSFNK
jgi:hypothetical protein